MVKPVRNPKMPTTYSIDVELRNWLREKSDACKIPASYFVNEALRRLKASEDEKTLSNEDENNE